MSSTINNLRSPRAFRRFGRKVLKTLLVFVVLISQLGPYTYIAKPAEAANSIPKLLNYQARITNSAGVPVTDGNLNIWVSVYDASSSGTCLYAMRGSCGTPSWKTVTVTNGVFSTLIGDAGDNAIPDALFDNDTLYLGITVASDTEMVPRKRIAAAPYAFNADRLDDLDASSSGGTVAHIVAATANGNLTIAGDPQGAAVSSGSVYINPAGATANETLIGIADNGTNRWMIDKEGDITHSGSLLATAASSTAQFIFRGAASQSNNIFEVQDSITNRVLSVSATATTVTNLIISGTCTGCSSVSTLQTAYDASTSTAEIYLGAARGALTLADSFSSFGGNLFEIQDRTNGAGAYSRRYLTVSSTSTLVNPSNTAGYVLGVGTSTPSGTVAIQSDTATQLWLTETAAGLASDIRFTNTARSWDVFADSSPDQFGVNHVGNARLEFSITPEGYMGIGSTNLTPNAFLQVHGDATAPTTSLLRLTNLEDSEPYFNFSSTSTQWTNKGDVAITLAADTDNVTEDDNPYILWSQDNATVTTIMGLTGNVGFDPQNSAYTDTNANTFLIGGRNASSQFQIGTNSAVRMTVTSGGFVGIGNNAPANLLTVGNATATFEVNAGGNLVRINSIPYSWPSTQGGVSTVLQNNGSGVLTWVSAGGTTNLNQAYLNSTSTTEIYLTGSQGAVTIADTFSGTGAIFEIQDRTNTAGDYSRRYLTVSSTSTNLRSNFDGDVIAQSGSDVFTLTDGAGFVRTQLKASGIQAWMMNDGTSNEAGRVTFSTPNGQPGISFLSETSTGRSDVRQLADTGGLSFGAVTDASVPASDMVLLTSGAFGLGDTSPDSEFELEFNQNAQTGLLVTNTTDGTAAQTALIMGGVSTRAGGLSLTSPAYTGVAGFGGALWLDANALGAAGTQHIILSAADDDSEIRFYTGGRASTNYRMTIGATGNVGIGDATPDSLLDILSSGAANTVVKIANTNAGDFDPSIGFELAEGTHAFTLGVDDSDADKFKISTTALGTNDRIVILSTGEVGIGTSSPASRLHVQETAAAVTRETVMRGTVSDGGNSLFELSNGTATNGLFLPTFSGYFDSTAASPSLTFRGIVSAANDASDSSSFGIVDFQALRSSSSADPNNGTLTAIVNRKLFTWSNLTTQMMTLMANGNFGIGNTAPANLLTVGNATATFEVNAGGNIVRINSVPYSWPSTQGGASSILQNNGSGVLSWAAAGSGATLQTAYDSSTGSTEIFLGSARGALTLADSFSSFNGNLFEIQNRINGTGDYSTRYFTVSSTSTAVGTTNPKARFQVANGSSGISFTPSARTAAIFEGSDANGTTISVIGPAGANATGIFLGRPNTEGLAQITWNDQNGTLNFASNAANTMVIDSNQQVAIGGNVLPSARLTVADPNSSPTSNIFEIQNTTPSFGTSYSARYFTVSSTATAIGSSSSTYALGVTNARISGNLTPTTDATFDLGDYDRRWRDLWLSGGSANIAYDTSGTSILRLGFESSQGLRGVIKTPDNIPLQLRSGNSATGGIYLTSAGATVDNLTVTGTCSGCSGAAVTLNQAYLNSTSTTELFITPSQGALSIADTFSGTGNIFEIQDRTNAAGDYSRRYFTVSSTATIASLAYEVTRTSTSGFASFTLNTGTTNQWSFQLRNDATNDLHIRDNINGRTAIFASQSTGNVGIGSTAPGARLTVLDGSASPVSNVLTVANLNDSARYLTVSSTATLMGVNSAGVAVSGYEVGIGQATPTARLHVTPDVNTTALQVSGYSLTGSNASTLASLTGTWNTSGAPVGLFMNITDTASSGNAQLMSLQQSGVSRFTVGKTGSTTITLNNALPITGISAIGLVNSDLTANNFSSIFFGDGLGAGSIISNQFLNHGVTNVSNVVFQTRDNAGTLATRLTIGATSTAVVGDLTVTGSISGTISTTLNQAYLNSTSTTELFLTPSQGALTIADTFSGTGDILQIQDRTNSAGDYSTRYLTVSSTATFMNSSVRISNPITASNQYSLYVEGGPVGTANGSIRFQGTNSSSHFYYGTNQDITLNPGQTAGSIFLNSTALNTGNVMIGGTNNVVGNARLTVIGTSASPTTNLFSVQNFNDSDRYLTVNSTSTNLTYNGAITSGSAAFNLTTNGITSGSAASFTTTATAFTGNMLNISSGANSAANTGNLLNLQVNNAVNRIKALQVSYPAVTSNLGTGGVNFNFAGNHTGTGFGIDDVTTNGYAMTINASNVQTGAGLLIDSTSSTSMGVGSALKIVGPSTCCSGSNSVGIAMDVRMSGNPTGNNSAAMVVFNATGMTTGIAQKIGMGDSTTTGTGLLITGRSNITSSSFLQLNKSISGATSLPYTGSFADIDYDQSYSGGANIISTGTLLNVSRYNQVNGASAWPRFTGAVANFVDDFDLLSGWVNHAASVVHIEEKFAGATNSALFVTDSATGGAAAYLAGSFTPLTIASRDVSPTYNLFEVQNSSYIDSATSQAPYTTRYFTVSATGTTVNNLTVTGTCTGCGSSTTLNQAYNNSTSTTEIYVTPTQGALTIADTFSGTGNIFEIVDRTNSAGDYSRQYLTVSSTATRLNYNDNTTNDALTVFAGGLTTGTGIKISTANTLTTGFGLDITGGAANSITTGGMLRVSTGSAAALSSGLIRFDANGAFTSSASNSGAFAVTADSMVSGVVQSISANSMTTGTALGLNTTAVYTGAAGVFNITANGATTGNVARINATGLTNGSALSIFGSGATMTAGGSLISANMGAATAGQAMQITTTGNYAGTGLVNINATTMTTGAGNALAITTGQTSGAGNALLVTNGAAFTSANGLVRINTTAAGQTGASLLVSTAATSNSLNGLVRFNFTGAGAHGTGSGFQIDDTATTGTSARINTTALTTGTALFLNNTSTAATASATAIGINFTANGSTATANSTTLISGVNSTTYNTAVTTPSITGNLINLSRSVQTSGSFASTLSVTGAVASFTDNAFQSTGTITHTANVLRLTQNAPASSGSVLQIQNNGAGGDVTGTDGNWFISKTGSATFLGDLTVGTASSTNSVNFAAARIGSNLTPTTDATFDLGDYNRRWRDLWLSGGSAHIAYDTSGTTSLNLGWNDTEGRRALFNSSSQPIQITPGGGLNGMYIDKFGRFGLGRTQLTSPSANFPAFLEIESASSTLYGVKIVTPSGAQTSNLVVVNSSNTITFNVDRFGTLYGNVGAHFKAALGDTNYVYENGSGGDSNMMRPRNGAASALSIMSVDNMSANDNLLNFYDNERDVLYTRFDRMGRLVFGATNTDPLALVTVATSTAVGTPYFLDIRDLTSPNGDYSQRYMTVSSTGTQVTNLVVTGTCTGCSGGAATLQTAYDSGTGTTGIFLGAAKGAFTLADSFSSFGGNLLEIQDRTNGAGDYSRRYFTVSSTSTNLSYTTNTTLGAMTLDAPAMTTGYAQTINVNGSTSLTTGGALRIVGPTGASSLGGGTGLVSIRSTGNFTTTTGSGGLLQVDATGMTAATVASITDGSAMTGNGRLLSLTANAATSVSELVDINANGLTTGTAVSIISTGNVTTTAGANTGTLLHVSKTGTVTTAAFSGSIANIDYSPTYTTTTTTNSGNVLNINRLISVTGASTQTINGAAVRIADNITQSAGTVNHGASTLEVSQGYASATGTVMKVTSNSTLGRAAYFSGAGGVTVASNKPSPTSNIFEVQNFTTSLGDYSERYMTVSSTGTTVTNLTVTGTCTGCGGGTLNQAYLNSTSTVEISQSPSFGAFTIQETVGGYDPEQIRYIGFGNIFEVTDRTNSAGDYSRRYFSVSATSTHIANNTLVFDADPLAQQNRISFGTTSGYITTTGSDLNLESSSLLFNNQNFITATDNGGQTTAGSDFFTIQSNSVRTSGSSLLTLADGVVGAAAGSSLLELSHISAAGGGITVTANQLTTGSAISIASSATGLTSGSLLTLTSATTGAVATNGIVEFEATGNFTSTSNVGLLNIKANSTTAGTIANIQGNALTTGTALRIANTGGGITSGSLLNVSASGGAGALTNGLLRVETNSSFTSSASQTGMLSVYSQTSTNGTLVGIHGDNTQSGTLLHLSGEDLITGNAISVYSFPGVGIGMTTGHLLDFDGRFRHTVTNEVGSMAKILMRDISTVTATSIGLLINPEFSSASINGTRTLTGLKVEGSFAPSGANCGSTQPHSCTFNGVDIATPALNVTAANTNSTFNGLNLSSAGSLGPSASGVRQLWNGLTMAMPSASTASGGVASATGISIVGPVSVGLTDVHYSMIDVSTSTYSVSTGVDQAINLNMAFTSTSANNTGLYGLNIKPQFNLFSNSAGTKSLAAINVENPTYTQCVTGSGKRCAFYGAILGGLGISQTHTSVDTLLYHGLDINQESNTLIQSGLAGTIEWRGIQMRMPNTTQTTGTVTSVGLEIFQGNVTSGSQNAIVLNANGDTNNFVVSGTGTVVVNLPLSTGNWAVCHRENSGASTKQTLVDCANAPAADYMEMYPAAADLTMGDIVMPGNVVVSASGGSMVPQVVKTDGAYKGAMIGVMSDPGDIGDFNAIGFNIHESDNPRPVALKGRVKVKVNMQNGPIAVGDPITSSDIAGVGMKSTKPGMIVGQALEAWNGPGQGMILVFMGNGWHSGMAIKTDGDMTLFGDDVAFDAKGTATSGTSFNSFGLNFRGSTWNGASNTAITRNISVLNETSDISNYQLAFRNDDNNLLASLNQAGDLSIAGSLSVEGGFDYAEMFPAVPDIEAGDIVMVDPDDANGYGVKKTQTAYENSAIGVISTKPGFLTGKNEEGSQPVALAGRVPVKVNMEGGEILPGDPITPSSTPGVGMKATEAGRVIGIALRGATADGMVMIFVNPSWWNGPMPIGGASANGALSIEQDSILDFKNSVLTNVAAIISTNGTWSITSDGYLTAEKVEAKEVVTETLKIKTAADTPERTVGVGRIQAGYEGTLITNPAVTADSLIVITFETNPGANWWIEEKQAGQFMLKLAQPAHADQKFTYWIVPVDGALDPAPPDTPPPTDSGSGTAETGSGSGTVETGSGSGTEETP